MPRLIGAALLLAAACAAVCAYFGCAFAFLAVVGKEILLGTTLLGFGALFGFYGNSLLSVYWRGARSLLPGVAVGMLLFGAYAELAWFTCQFAAVTTNSLLGHVGALVLTPVDWEISLLTGTQHPHRYGRILAAGFLLFSAKFMLLPPFLLAARGLETTTRSTTQPAYVQYFRSEALPDVGVTLRRTLGGLVDVVSPVVGLAVKSLAGPQGLVLWPLTLSVVGGLVPPAMASLGVAALVGGLHGMATLGTIAFQGAWGGLLWGIERAVLFARSRYAACPHASCHERVPLPTFACGTCGVTHDRLVPDRHGVFLRRCQCGTSLPTLFWLGKGRLAASCPHCRQAMPAATFAANLHIPLYGAHGAGKTMLLTTAAWRLLERPIAGTSASLVEDKARQDWKRLWRPRLLRGQVADKTTALYPDALLLNVLRAGGIPVSLYLYDAAGEVTETGARLDEHRFLRLVNGIVFVVDGRTLANGTPAVPLTDQIANLRNACAALGVGERGRRVPIRLAAVVSHADTPAVTDGLGSDARAGRVPQAWDEAGRGRSATVRAWLHERDPAAVLALETGFERVRFFAASATGRAAPGESFEPWAPELPFAWIAAGSLPLRNPRLASSLAFALEAAAVLLALSPLLLGGLALLGGAGTALFLSLG